MVLIVSDEKLEQLGEDYRRLKLAGVMPMTFEDYADFEVQMDNVEKRATLQTIYNRMRGGKYGNGN